MILVLCARKFAVHDWYESLGEELFLLTSDEIVDFFLKDKFAYIETFSDFWSNPMVMRRAMQLHKKHTFRKIIGPTELDMIRSAKLREHLNIEGLQSSDSALQYRDKVYMKDKVKAGGLRVPRYRRLHDEMDLLSFIDENGFPVLLKPLSAFGSIGVKVLWSEHDLDDYLRSKPIFLGYEAEEYIEGTLYTVDGVVINDEVVFISTSEYVGGNLIDLDSSGINGNWILHPTNPLSKRLIAYTKKMIQALDTPKHAVFHAELFHTVDDDIVLCEIACRCPGSHLPHCIDYTYDVDLVKLMFQIHVETPIHLPNDGENHNPEKLYGFVYFTPKEGRIVSLPIDNPPDWVVDYQLLGKVGQEYPKDVNYDYPYAYMIFESETEEGLKARTVEICEWFTSRVEWDHENRLETVEIGV
ncbi:ATP-grasp domain-containing protein [Shimazuella kribbensis]|uniref:ATP-grasp domain-containing protein n=1 Tax=Shimazuella kribbensis TaxID=139808 RepID=UPI0004244A3D|nr:hypothetical protein [Shimazuella kribbensis]